jgi:hypothetical protein
VGDPLGDQPLHHLAAALSWRAERVSAHPARG